MSGYASQIRQYMEVVGSDGRHVGTVDRLEEDRIKLTKQDDPDGSGRHHHFLPVSSIAAVDGPKVRLNLPADRARALATITGDSPLAAGMGGMSSGC
ncbi:DUF2171 domain-containing protein [Plastoroseomonas hellenica]|uniref:DUF2171 domain-containing protein n=1 Tax=Plastoroseomonas hellenica TaxID=2687306 RepID=UPI001BA9CCEB|nr:DUF2171 domain-containing protein [Plastoroseomonas hellenica]MBR0646097.1 DUF2171 domain-containing protein [Plastoroseomonas hellenica]